MKICLIIKGPIRPNKDVVLDNIRTISSSLIGYDYDIIFSTWDNDVVAASEIIKTVCPTYSIISKIPNIDFNFKEHSFNAKNCFNQFYLTNKSIDFAISLNSYDYIIITRTDLKMKIDLKNWIKKDSYVTIHSKQCGQPFTNDQFGVASPKIMKLVWNYNNELDLCMAIDSSVYPEQIIDSNIDKNNISVLQQQFILWEIVR